MKTVTRIVAPLLIISLAFLYFTLKAARPTQEGSFRKVLGISNQFASETAGLVPQFEELIKKANESIDQRSERAKRFGAAADALAWTAVGLTVIVTILAGMLGVDAKNILTSPKPKGRGTLIVVLTFAAATSAALQVIDAKVQRDKAQNKQAAEQLFQETAGARSRFASAGRSVEAAQQAAETLKKAIFEDALDR
jgi:ABC-type multidrug transport system fused ATPase/permease subunit